MRSDAQLLSKLKVLLASYNFSGQVLDNGVSGVFSYQGRTAYAELYTDHTELAVVVDCQTHATYVRFPLDVDPKNLAIFMIGSIAYND